VTTPTSPAEQLTAPYSDAAEAVSLFAKQLQAGEVADEEQFLQRRPEFARHLVVLRHVRMLADGTPRAFGSYELQEPLGQGGMGTVYRARQSGAGRVVALKVIRPDRLAELPPEHREAWLARFRREAEAAGRLTHDNIVTVYEVGEHAGRPFYSMRYIEGRTLKELARDGPLPAGRAAELMEAVARAAAHAHGCGFVHRDLTPRNVLVDATGRPFVVDFGLVKCLEDPAGGTQAGDALGTPSYMAPEQVRDASTVGPAADVYGLGATLYEMLTGRPPFQAATRAETLMQVLERSPVPPRAVNASVPADLEAVCLKCLEKAPADRPSAAELADDLRRFRNGEPVKARPPGYAESIVRELERRRSMAGARRWAALEFWDVGVSLIFHPLLYVLLRLGAPAPLLWLWLGAMAASYWAFSAWVSGRLPPASREKDINLLWAGATLAAAVLFFLHCPPTGPVRPDDVAAFYPPYTVVVGMCMLVLGRLYWGRYYLVGLGCFVLAALMPLRIDLAPLAFGLGNATAMAWCGWGHLRVARREAAAAPPRHAGA
jgi:serine/threonine-protein kinase